MNLLPTARTRRVAAAAALLAALAGPAAAQTTPTIDISVRDGKASVAGGEFVLDQDQPAWLFRIVTTGVRFGPAGVRVPDDVLRCEAANTQRTQMRCTRVSGASTLGLAYSLELVQARPGALPNTWVQN